MDRACNPHVDEVLVPARSEERAAKGPVDVFVTKRSLTGTELPPHGLMAGQCQRSSASGASRDVESSSCTRGFGAPFGLYVCSAAGKDPSCTSRM